jgi:hypothetical protein
MPWTWKRIEKEWLADGRVAHISEVTIDSFKEVERVLGAGWIDDVRKKGRGSIPAASIVGTGQQLRSLRRVVNPADIVQKLRDDNRSAWGELAAIHALAGHREDVEIEVGPEVKVKGKPKKPDFRLRCNGDAWTYVEVSRPNTSEERRHLQTIMNRITTVLSTVEGHYVLEVYLRREPTPDELDIIIERGTDLCRQSGVVQEDLPNQLGLLVTNDMPIGVVIPKERDPGNRRPVLGMSRGVVTNGVPERHVLVRLAYSDQRAEALLRNEARQLPTDSPGLIVLETGATGGSAREWLEVFGHRLQPGLHTRVGAIMLVSSGIETTAGGATWKQTTHGIVNPHAALPLPQWIAEVVAH